MNPSPLVAKLVDSASSLFTLGTDDTQVLALMPQIASVNPNEATRNSYFDSFQYVCKASNESWPNANGMLPMAYTNNNGFTPTATYKPSPNRPFTGCFTNGPGALNVSTGNWTIAGQWFVPGINYDMGVVVSKTYLVDGVNVTVTAMANVTLVITPGAPPNLRIV